MERKTFRVVPIDGVLADVRTPFIEIASSRLGIPLEVPTDLAPPHTIRTLCKAAGLDAVQFAQVAATIRGIRDFWLSVPSMPSWPDWNVATDELPVFHTLRMPTVGKPALQQTIEWMTRCGFHNPIVWLEEEV
jgi:hypothetical protein